MTVEKGLGYTPTSQGQELTSLEESGWVYGALEDVVTSLIRSIVRTISLLVWFWGRKRLLV